MYSLSLVVLFLLFTGLQCLSYIFLTLSSFVINSLSYPFASPLSIGKHTNIYFFFCWCVSYPYFNVSISFSSSSLAFFSFSYSFFSLVNSPIDLFNIYSPDLLKCYHYYFELFIGNFDVNGRILILGCFKVWL